MRLILLLLFIFLFQNSFGQNDNSVIVIILSKGMQYQRVNVYDVSIKNNSDTPICILHSVFLKLSKDSSQTLPLYNYSNSKEHYSLYYSITDSLNNFERTLYSGEFVMPHQDISFKISTPASLKEKFLNFEYIYLPDFCYKQIVTDMNKMAVWYNKYKIKDKSIKMPSHL